MRRAVMVSAVTAALVAGGAPLAAAAPPEQEPITLLCDDGETYEQLASDRSAFEDYDIDVGYGPGVFRERWVDETATNQEEIDLVHQMGGLAIVMVRALSLRSHYEDALETGRQLSGGFRLRARMPLAPRSGDAA